MSNELELLDDDFVKIVKDELTELLGGEKSQRQIKKWSIFI